MDESIEEFLKSNERHVNKILSISIFLLIPLIPIIILASYIGFLPTLDISYILLAWLLLTAFCVHYYFFGSKEIPDNHKKYVLLGALEVIAFLISITKGLNVYFCYCFVVVISCIYFDLNFSGIVAAVSYVFMVISFILRTDRLVEGFYIDTPQNWITNTIIGSSMEFFALVTVCMYLSQTTRKILRSLYKHKKNIYNTQNSLISGFANMIEAKDSNTGGHIKRTSEYVRIICEKLMEKGLYSDFVDAHTAELMYRAAPFHDLGKISIPEYILNKPGKLSQEEFELIRNHPTDGADFIITRLGTIEDEDFIQTARDMALCHHEHVDGTGYPKALRGDEIPVSARIMADVLDALLSNRSYKKPYTVTESLEIIKGMAGKTLDPVIVFALVSAEDEIKYILEGGGIHYENTETKTERN